MTPFAPTREKPPILIVGNFLSQSRSVRTVCEDISAGLRARGWQVTTTSSLEERVPRLVDMLLTTWLKRDSYAVAEVDTYSGPAFAWAEMVSASLATLRCPFVLTLHGGNLPIFAKRWPRRVRRLLQSATIVTAPSSYLQQGLKPFRPDIRVIPNSLDISLYPIRDYNTVRPRLVWVRAFHEIYNPCLAVSAVGRLRSEFPEISLLMVGPDKGDGSAARTAARVHELGLDDRVTMVGPVAKEAIPSYLQQGDIFLNTTNVDNTPVTVVEAMACGLCIVSTDVGGIPWLLEDGVDALLVPKADPGAMADAARRILLDRDLAVELGANARRKAEGFDRHKILAQWEDLFAAVAASRRK
jgi:glycosyltransferase involved in cell wall biosynthesis